MEISRIYRFDDFKVDTIEESLSKGDQRLSINRRTFNVLRLLVERSGEIITKQDFFDTVWADTFVEDNSLTVAVTTLRKLLGEDAKNPKYIENLPRKGYRFIGEVTYTDEKRKAGPKGLTVDPELPAGPAVYSGRRRTLIKERKILAAILVFCLTAFAAVFGFTYLTPSRSNQAEPKRIDSIAVIPFESDVPDTEYLTDGLADSLIDRLANMPNLRVISRNSSFKYKNKPIDPAVVGRELNVRKILTGRIDQTGGNIIVQVKIVDSSNNENVWQRTYNKPMTDILELQDVMSEDVASVLRTATARNTPELVKRGTNDAEAYLLYLKGRHFWNKRSVADCRKAINYYQQALDRDPSFALAYAGLATCYAQSDAVPGETENERSARVVGAARKALEFDPNLGEPYAIIALTETYHLWDMTSAGHNFQRAIEIDPGNATIHHWYAEFLAMQGRFDESFREYNAAYERDPLSFAIMTDRAYNYFYARDYDRAAAELEKVRQINPGYERTYYFLYKTYEVKGMFERALESLDQYYFLQNENNQLSKERFVLYKQLNNESIKSLKTFGQNAYWQKRIKFILNEGDGPSAFGLAVAYSKSGDLETALGHLERSVGSHDASLVWLKVTPDFDNLREDPRFAAAMRRVGVLE